MWKTSFVILVLGGIVGTLLAVVLWNVKTPFVSPVAEKNTPIQELPLEKYSIESLAVRAPRAGDIVLDDAIATTSAYTAYLFHFTSDQKRVSGVVRIPTGDGPFPAIVQFRGYVDQKIYTPGMGTTKSSEVFASHGFVSIAPDFLGYGTSDMPSGSIFEERFQTYTVALDMLDAVSRFPYVDADRVGIWAHSNGGQIALTILEALGTPTPLALWAPVTRSFPYSILYYSEELIDRGKFLRKELAAFEEEYDVERYSLVNYLDRLTGPIQLHQGTLDDAVPVLWSQEFVDALRNLEVDVTYYEYPGVDHNMSGPPTGGWNTVIQRDREFFEREL